MKGSIRSKRNKNFITLINSAFNDRELCKKKTVMLALLSGSSRFDVGTYLEVLSDSSKAGMGTSSYPEMVQWKEHMTATKNFVSIKA